MRRASFLHFLCETVEEDDSVTAASITEMASGQCWCWTLPRDPGLCAVLETAVGTLPGDAAWGVTCSSNSPSSIPHLLCDPWTVISFPQTSVSASIKWE